MTTTPQIQTLDQLLEASQATPDFKKAVQSLADTQQPSERIRFNPGAPPVKVLRLICKILEELPAEPLESIDVTAASGCSNFDGTATLLPGPRKLTFSWDCAWRAREQGWADPFGDPDQIRAAREFGYQCFQRFELTHQH